MNSFKNVLKMFLKGILFFPVILIDCILVIPMIIILIATGNLIKSTTQRLFEW